MAAVSTRCDVVTWCDVEVGARCMVAVFFSFSCNEWMNVLAK